VGGDRPSEEGEKFMPKKVVKQKKPKKKRTAAKPPKSLDHEEFGWKRNTHVASDEDWAFDNEKW